MSTNGIHDPQLSTIVLICGRCSMSYRALSAEAELLRRCLCGGALTRDIKREIQELLDNPALTLPEIEPRLRALLASMRKSDVQ
jgi:PHP family Zn ribbon phosphoesterase